jgi:hypothetical protein
MGRAETRRGGTLGCRHYEANVYRLDGKLILKGGNLNGKNVSADYEDGDGDA